MSRPDKAGGTRPRTSMSTSCEVWSDGPVDEGMTCIVGLRRLGPHRAQPLRS